MKAIEFHLSRSSMLFGGFEANLKEAEFVVFGVPFDATSSYRPGSRFAPSTIRNAALNIETFSLRTKLDASELKIHDAGDLTNTTSVSSTIRGITEVVREILSLGKVPVVLGGEHTLTFGAVEAIEGNRGVIIFDAHLDLRDQYPIGIKWSHATVTRRIVESIGSRNVVCVGTRAFCKEEYEYANENKLIYITSHEVVEEGARKTGSKLNRIIDELGLEKIWLSIDLDVLDPSAAPGVANPEPEGLTVKQLLDIISEVVSIKVVGFDIVEAAPGYDRGITAIQAAKIALETCCLIHKARLSTS
ncbi:MAG: agmatinase [Candidatus Methanomethylicota archaeon]|uniref:Agmatinase n=1 Tax=Thermoproteota archaeon TaxID=2056631 RepID=A0A497F5T3_9CREN|nr:MAG: agmatinase [Candidatus Verstraetearchaeota archaeon]RLI19062.1 MAG: agmatinase [Candidatus Bathyarchaeota archaeon]